MTSVGGRFPRPSLGGFRISVFANGLFNDEIIVLLGDDRSEKGRRWKLFRVTADYGAFTSIKCGHGVLDTHLRGFIENHDIEQASLQREDATGHVRVHQPDWSSCEQPYIEAQVEDLP